MLESSPSIKVNVRLPHSLREAALAACEAESRTFSNVVRIALREWLEDNKYLD